MSEPSDAARASERSDAARVSDASEAAFARTVGSESDPGASAASWPGVTEVGAAFDAAGRYVTERLLGSGGMGSAWLARDTLLLRPCVIKVLHGAAHEDREKLARFLREARLLARLKSEHVVAIHDFGITRGGVPFLVLEHIEGQPLDTVLAASGKLSVLRAVAIGVQMLRGLRTAHAAGVVHHDLKPANVFMARTGTVVLLDFGVAAFAGAPDDPSAAVLRDDDRTGGAGTPYYMAPEQWGGARADVRSDLWSVGVVLFELWAGRLPFRADTIAGIAGLVLTEEPRYPEPSRTPGEEELRTLVVHALAKNPADRPESADAMLATLERLWESLTRGAPAQSLTARASGTMPAPILDADVQFTVYQPDILPPETWVKVLAFAHRALDDAERAALPYDDPLAEIARRAEVVLGEAATERYAQRSEPSRVEVPREHELTFVPTARHVTFDPRSRTFVWSEPVHQESFLARAERSLDGRAAGARLQVFLGALLLCEVPFALAVDASKSAPDRPKTVARARPFGRVFVSYAAEDLAVAQQIKSLSQLLSGTRYVEAGPIERAAQRMDESSGRAIDESDALQVLWSSAALESALVDAELRYALERHDVDFVRAVTWQAPPPFDVARDRPPAALRQRELTQLAAPANALLLAISGGQELGGAGGSLGAPMALAGAAAAMAMGAAPMLAGGTTASAAPAQSPEAARHPKRAGLPLTAIGTALSAALALLFVFRSGTSELSPPTVGAPPSGLGLPMMPLSPVPPVAGTVPGTVPGTDPPVTLPIETGSSGGSSTSSGGSGGSSAGSSSGGVGLHHHSSAGGGGGSGGGSGDEHALDDLLDRAMGSGGGSGGSGGDDRSLDDLLNRATSSGGSGGRAGSSSSSGGAAADLPETPNRADVVSAMDVVQPAVAACGAGAHGTATVALVVAGSTGRVVNATVSGDFAGTPVGSCIARAVRRAVFPQFSRASYTVDYPFRF